ncbi:MAG: Nif3-like dinuclear metal center hexameric protein [Caldisericales bacterium]|nr:Nif3-like dinuclear metal center hexameric protein [Caldisericales bacterium]
MAISPGQIARWLDEALVVPQAKGDSSANGLQVDASEPVTKLGFAVDACMDAFTEAKNQGCHMLLCHHGLYWKGDDQRATGLMGNRISYLIRNGVSLWACHLPLDMHPKYGNNAVLSIILGINNRKSFGMYHDLPLGFFGEVEGNPTCGELAQRLSDGVLECKPWIWSFGKKSCKNIGVVSGGGSYAIEEAAGLGLDCLVTGEVLHQDYHTAKELGINIIVAGHWATETVGILSAGKAVATFFGLESVFINKPTGL